MRIEKNIYLKTIIQPGLEVQYKLIIFIIQIAY